MISSDGSKIAFTANSAQGVKDHFGCCDKTAVMSVDLKTANSTLGQMHRLDEISGTKCGLWGCGIMSLGNYDAKEGTVIGWVEKLLPPPPPTAPKIGAIERKTKAARRGEKPDPLGTSLVSIELSSMKATTISPFSFDLNKAKGPAPVSGFVPAFDDKNSIMYHGCNPDASDFDTEGVCWIHVSKTKKEPSMKTSKWNLPKNWTMTDIKYSQALSEVVFMAQTLPGIDTSKMSGTKIYTFNPSTEKYAELVDLGESWGDLHQTTMSADGKYLMAHVQTGKQIPNIGPQFTHSIVIDVVAKKVVQNVVAKDGENLAFLSTFTC